MKKLLVALAVVSFTAIASADPVPAPLQIDRIEVRNSNATQGFAIQGGRAECEELAKVSGPDSVKTYIEERTFVCLAGNECRARRPGETTAGD